MNGVALLIALSSLGVDYGVQRSEDGKLEYVIQIEPEYLRLLSDGQQIHSDVPPDAGQVERVLVRVGTAPVKHSQAHLAEYRRLLVSGSRVASSVPGRAAPDSSAPIVWPAKAKPEINYHVTYGFQPDQAGVVSYFVQLNPTLLASLAVGDEVRATLDPAAGRVGRFVIHAGDAELPKIPVEPVAAPAPLAGAPGSRRGAIDRPGFGTGAAATTQPNFGPAPVTPLSSTPDYAAAPNFGGDQPQYPARGGFNYGGASDVGTDLRTPPPAIAPPAYSQPPAAYDNRYERPRAAEQPPVDYGPPAGYIARTAAEQPQLPPRNNTYAPPAVNYAPHPAAPQPAVDERLASVTRNPPTTSDRLPAPQINPISNTRPASETGAADKPWMPLMFTAFALFLSIGGNLYLGWTAAEFYSRYRLATDRLRSAGRS